MCKTWLTTIIHDTTVHRTRSGTTPGAPLADVLFQMVFSLFVDNMLRDLEESLHQVVVPGLQNNEQNHGTLPSWLDDIAVLVKEQQAAGVAPALQEITKSAYQHLGAVGTQVNFNPGKTEAVIAFRGHEARRYSHYWFVECDRRMRVQVSEHVGVELVLSDQYVHLGCLVTSENKQHAEVQRRQRLVEGIFQNLRKRVLHNPCLTSSEKTDLIESTIMNKFMHGAGTWSLLTDKAANAYRVAHMSFVRKSVRPLTKLSSKLMTDEEACAVTGLITPEERISMARARQLLVIAESGCRFLQGLVFGEGRWLTKAAHDFNRIREELNHALPQCVLQNATGFDEWLRVVATRKASYKGMLRKYRKDVLHKLQAYRKHALCKAEARRDLECLGVVCVKLQEHVEASASDHVCRRCAMHFANAGALASHESRVHGDVAAATLATTGSRCEVCRKEFWLTHRLKSHLRRFETCRGVHLTADLQPMSDAPADLQRPWKPACNFIGPQPFRATMRPEVVATEAPKEISLEARLKVLFQGFMKASAR